MSRAVYWQSLLDSGHVANIRELAKSEGLDKICGTRTWRRTA